MAQSKSLGPLVPSLSKGAANLDQRAWPLRPMPLLHAVQLVSGSRPAHCKPLLAHRNTHALPARYAGPNCHRKRYQPRPRKWKAALAKGVRSCAGLVQAWSGSEPLLETCGSTLIPILTPVQGQIEFAINEAMSFGGHIREKDTDLTILDPTSGPPQYCKPTPADCLPRLGKPLSSMTRIADCKPSCSST